MRMMRRMKDFLIVLRYRHDGKTETTPITTFTASTRAEAESRAQKWLEVTHCPGAQFMEFVSVQIKTEDKASAP